MIHPTEMRKVSILGPASRMETVIERLHDLGVLHIDEYEEELELANIGDPGEEAEELSEELVKVRSLASKLPDAENGGRADRDVTEAIDEIGRQVSEIEEELERLDDDIETKQETRETLEVVDRLGLDLDAFQEVESVDIYLGTVDDFSFTDVLEDGRSELVREGDTVAVFADPDLGVGEALQDSGFDPIDIEPLLVRDGDVADALAEVEESIDRLQMQKDELEAELEDLGATWRDELAEREQVLSAELEKAEAPLDFAMTDNAFVAEGWIPAEEYDRVVEELEQATEGSVYIEAMDAGEDAPVKHDNPERVQPLESLMGLYGTPSYGEVDPTFLLLTFPILFGFMLADIGYGLTTLAVFYLFARKFPEAKELWHSMMYASVATIAFGLLTGEMFGFLIFGEHGILTQRIPILFHREHMTGQLVNMAVLIGVAHVNLGFLIGAYNEYLHHGVMEAVFAKLSWIVIEIGAVLAVATSYGRVGWGIAAAGILMLYRGEKVEGIVEIPSLMSNVLSYLRIFGVIMAVLVLAKVVNALAMPLFQSGSILMAGLGVVILVVGHTLNTFLKAMECGLQGIRLHYVEFFTKFFEGGGTLYRPFGAKTGGSS